MKIPLLESEEIEINHKRPNDSQIGRIKETLIDKKFISPQLKEINLKAMPVKFNEGEVAHLRNELQESKTLIEILKNEIKNLEVKT